jgi:hypothetical protein
MNNQDKNELHLDELDAVNGGLTLDTKGRAVSADNNVKSERDLFDRILKSINSLLHGSGFTR